MSKLVLDWAGNDDLADLDQQSHEHTNALREKFDFVFMLLLKAIDCDIPLEKVIIQQHHLEEKDITQDEIKTILDSSKCLLVFDGYDEYKKGTNSDIDSVVSGKRGNCFVPVTSRPDYMDKKDKKNMDGVIQMVGLSDESITECIDRYFGKVGNTQSETTSQDPEPAKVSSQEFMTKANRRGI